MYMAAVAWGIIYIISIMVIMKNDLFSWLQLRLLVIAASPATQALGEVGAKPTDRLRNRAWKSAPYRRHLSRQIMQLDDRGLCRPLHGASRPRGCSWQAPKDLEAASATECSGNNGRLRL